MLKKKQKYIRRHRRVRAKIKGTKDVPRFSVFRSNKNIYAQLIDDEKRETLVAASDKEFKKSEIRNPKSLPADASRQAMQAGETNSKSKILKKEKKMTGKILAAYEVGKLIAEKAIKKDIKKVVFDRGGRKYHGRVKAVADGAREGGLKF